MYGAVQLYVLNREEEWRHKVQQLSAFYLSHVCTDGVPAWDLMLSGEDTALKDASAAAIACSAFFSIRRSLKQSRSLAPAHPATRRANTGYFDFCGICSFGS
ncbi:hypothetical protein ACFTAO_08190 [Paenibacillus rhizoplanae]